MAKMTKAEQRIPVYRPGSERPPPIAWRSPIPASAAACDHAPAAVVSVRSTPKADGTHGAAKGHKRPPALQKKIMALAPNPATNPLPGPRRSV